MRPAPSIENFPADRPRALKAARSRRASLRRRTIAATVEGLESRTLMAVLPAVTTSGTLAEIRTGYSDGVTVNYSTPSILIDPSNPQKLVASWQVAITGDANVDEFVQAASSTDGGQTWSVFYTSTPHLDPTVAENPPTLRDTTDITVAMDRNSTVYILSRNHNAGNSLGYLDLDVYTFSGNTASQVSPRQTLANWNGADQVVDPTMVVDNNLPSYTDTSSAGVTHTIVDQYAGNVYVAWVTNPNEAHQPANVPRLPNRVVMIASSNQGDTFTPWHTVDDRQGNALNASPQLVVSQGSFDGSVPAGQVTIAWDDFNTGWTNGENPPVDYLRSDRVTDGAVGAAFKANAFQPITDAADSGDKDVPSTAATTDVPIEVNITDLNFTTLSSMSVGLWITAPNVDQLSIELVAPNGLGSITLLRNKTNGLGQGTDGRGGSGANLGTGYLSTTFDDGALTRINDAGSGAGAYLGRFRPEGGSLLSLFQGKTAEQLSGTWTLRVTDYRYSNLKTPATDQVVNTVELKFGSGVTTGGDSLIAKTSVRGAAANGAGIATFPTAAAVTPNGIGPGLTLAADNTLGAFSPYQGRIYAAYVNRIVADGNPADNTDVYLKYSDDGGQTWTGTKRVNDDFPQQDGFSEGDRPQFLPAIAVDQTTGTVVYSYFDARYDAARARVVTMVSASIDGGASFSPSTYANPSRTVTDAITGEVLTPGPIPVNQSPGNPVRETAFGFGDRQALAVRGGTIYAAWASNIAMDGGQYLTGGRDGNQRLSIALRTLQTAAGPRVVSGTMGPVGLPGDGLNGSRLPDGTPVANSIIVNFDRPVDPATFTPADVQVIYRNTDAATNGSPTSLGIRSVTAMNTGQFGATQFKIVFVSPTDPDGIGGNGVGTYSYIIGPNVNDRIRHGSARINNAVSTTHATNIGPLGQLIPASGTITSPIVVNTGYPGEAIAGVAVHVSIMFPSTGDLKLTLISPQGTRVVLAQGLGGNVGNGYGDTTFKDGGPARIITADAPFNGTFRPQELLTYLNGEKPDGTWKLEITSNDGDPRNTGILYSWSLTLDGGGMAPPNPAGNLMDQNANGNAGQSIGDRFAVPTPLNGDGTLNPPFDPDTLPLIVSGPYLQSTHVSGTPASYDNLVLNNTAASIDLTFDRYMDAGSFTSEDILRIQGPSGVIPGPYTITPVYNSTNVNIGIPANNTTTSVLNIPTIGGPFTIGDLNVQVNISHAHAADLTLTLIAPDGTRVKLAQGLGGTVGKNYTDTVFDDQADDPVASGAAPFNGTFRPAESLAVLNGLDLTSGQWKLEVVNAAGLVGTLNAWSLAVTPKAGTNAYAQNFRVGFDRQELSGTYIVNLNSGIKSMAGDALDSNHNAGLDILRGTVPPGGATIPVTYTNSAPKPIPDATATDDDGDDTTPPVITPGVLNSTINIADSYVPTDVTVTLSINDPYVPDLEVTLVAPDGTRVTLVNQRGQGVNTANFQGTIFNDAGTTPIQNGGAPFNGGPYKPEPTTPDGTPNSLHAIINKQVNVNGQWTLEVKDHKTGNTGTLVTWSLTFQKPIPGSGLGEVSADRTETSFRIFTMAPDNALSSATWTPVGPGANGAGRSRIGGVAIDPSDPSGNTVYIGGASGGVWKTTNFMTTAPGGPTYIPVTNFGPTNSANIGGIVVIGRNNDPSQSIVFVTTGEGDSGSSGTGMLRSMDGGATWVALDSTVNFDSAGNMLPYNSPLRDHAFIGSTSYKIVADPKLSPTGDAIVYAALSGNNGGIWRSEDSGRTWGVVDPATGKRVANLAGQATDVELAQNSGTGAPGGNLQQVFAALRGDGVYFSPNRGQVWTKMAGGVGNPLIQDGDKDPSTPIPVTAPVDTPNGPKGRIVLAVPQLTGDPKQDIQYQGWLYATVVTTNDHLDGVYLTKDFGRNWTRVRIPTLPPTPGAGGGNSQVQATPTNDYSAKNPDYDVAGNAVFAQGNYDIAMTIDPTNPNVIYIGGTNDGQPSSLIRIDVTHINDAHSAVAFDEGNPDGGKNSTATTGGIAVKTPTDPDTALPRNYYNLNGQPGNPDGSSTFKVTNTAGFTNDGTNVTWTPFDFTIGDNHRFIAIKDPLTGHARLIAGDDHGVWTAVDNNGVQTSGVGTAATPSGDRTGNLQQTQFYYGAAMPDGSAFLGQAQDNGSSTSPNVLETGSLGWNVQLGDGTGVATDQTGTGTVYRYNWPCCGGDGTNFFQVNGIGRTQGLILDNQPGSFPDPSQWPFVGGFNFAVNPLNGNQILISSGTGRVFSTENQGRFWSVIGEPAVFGNSHAEALAYGAPDPNGPAGLGNLDNFLYVGTGAGKIYMSQVGGGGSGNAWTDISAGLDGSGIRSIVTNPNRGSHEAYAVTNSGVYHIVDSTVPGATWQNITGKDLPGKPPGNLFSLTHNLFGDPTQVDTILRGITSLAIDWRYVIPADFTNPSPVGTFPILYVGGNGGVFRSIDNGTTWTRFPDAALNNTPVQAGDGGLFPVVQVNDLDLALGNIDPTTGRPSTYNSQNVLLASTYGQGAFAIRLAPVVFPDSLSIDHTAPLPANQGGSDSGNTPANQRDGITNVLTPVIDGFSASTAFGQVVTIKLYDLTDPTNPVQIGQGTTDAKGFFKVQVDPGHFLPDGSTDGPKIIGVQASDQNQAVGNMERVNLTIDHTVPAKPAAPDLQASSDHGDSDSDNITNVSNPTFNVQVIENKARVVLYRDGVAVADFSDVVPDADGVYTITDPSAPEGSHVYTVEQYDVATNRSVMSDPLSVLFDYTLPAAPAAPDLKAADDSGISNSDNNTATTTGLRFDTTLVEPNAKLELLRDGVVVNSIANVGAAGGAVTIADLTALADGTYVYTLRQTDLAGNLGPASDPLTVTVDTSAPAAPAVPDLQAGDDLGSSDSDNVTKQNVNLHFDILGIEPDGKNATVSLYRDGVFVVSVDYSTSGQVTLIDPTTLADGTYVYTATQTDLAGNVSPVSGGLTVTIDTVAPVAPSAPDLRAADDSGTFHDDDYTKVTTNLRFDTTLIEPFAKLELLRDGVIVNTITNVGSTGGAVTITDPTALADGVYVYTLQQTDLAGNLGPQSAPLTVTVDTTNPAAPSVPDLQAASDSGVFNNDDITFITNPTFDIGSAESTAIVHLLRNGVEVATRTGPGAIQDPGPVPDGVYSYTSYQTDLAGNVGPTSAPLTVTIDTTAPAGPVPDLQPGSDTGQSNSDNLTSATLLALVGGYPKFDVSPVEQGGFVELFRNGVLVDSGRLLSSAGTITLSDRGPSFADGTYIYTARQTDLAGNVGTIGAALVVTIDNAAPTAPSAPDLQASSDSGASDTDNVTSVTNPKFDITDTEAGTTLKLLRDGAVVATLTNIAGGTTTIQDPGPVSDGTHVYSAYAIDQAGNIGPIGGALRVTINTSAAAAPATPDLQAASDSGSSVTDNLTNVNAPTFDVANVDPGATIQLYRDGVLVNSQVNTQGVNATVAIQDLGPVQPDGAYSYTARQISASGIAGPLSGALVVTIDTVAAVPDAPDLQAASDTGDSSTDNVTTVTTPTFDVTGAEAGAAVALYRKAAGADDDTYKIVATRTGNGPITDPGPLADGTYVYSLMETDAAGNVSDRSGALSVTISTAPPGAPAAPDLQAGSDTGTTDTDNVTNLRALKFDVVVAAADRDATVRLLRNGVIVATAPGGTGTLQGDGTYKYALTDTVPADGSYNYSSQTVNSTGTPSPAGPALLVRIDSLAPTALNAPDLQAASDTGDPTDNVTSATAPVFDASGGVEAGATVQLLRKPSGAADSAYAVVGSVTNGGTGVATIAVTDTSLPPNGAYDYAVRQIDVAGNLSPISQVSAVTIDTTTPGTPAAPDLQAASDSGASSTDNVTNVVGGKKGKDQLPAPTFDITGVAAGLDVQLLRKPAGANDSNYTVVNSVKTGDGAAAIADPGPILDGKYEYALRASTAAGGLSPLSPSLTVTFDTKPVAVIDPVLSNTYGARPATTVSRAPTFTGKTEPGVILGLFVDGPAGRVKVGHAVSDANGNYSITADQPMLNGTYRFSLAVLDFAGNLPANGSPFGNTAAVTVTSVTNDYDGDGKTDLVFDRQGANPGDPSTWQILGSTSGLQTLLFGAKGDIPLSGDFNGDGKADLALYRPANANLQYPVFIIKLSGGPNVIYAFGGNGDVPVPADFDGDGKTDMALYRPGTGQWFIHSSLTGANMLRVLGGAAGDVPVPGDYLGTGSAQPAVFRQPDASYAYPYYQVQSPTAGTPDTFYSVGGILDTPVPGDYNGDGKTDFAVYRTSSAMWYIRYLGGGGQNVQVGVANDIPVVGDFDGDGKADAGTYHPATGLWSINQSTAGPRVQSFGGSATDIPVAAGYGYRKQASVSATVTGVRATSGAFDLGGTAAKLSNTLSASRAVVNQETPKKR